MSEESSPDVTSLTVQLLSAYLANNTVASDDLAGLIATTRAALSAQVSVDEPAAEQTYEPAVSLRKSLSSRDHIISLIDGKPYKMLKRHLLGHGLSPAEYRARYNLPADYPMVAPAYSDRRREVAMNLGLGRKDTKPTATPDVPEKASEGVESSGAKRGRKAKSLPDAVALSTATEGAAETTAQTPTRAKAAQKAPRAVKAKVAKAADLTQDVAAPTPAAPEGAVPEVKPKRTRAPKAAVTKDVTTKADAPKQGKPKSDTVAKAARPKRMVRTPEDTSKSPA